MSKDESPRPIPTPESRPDPSGKPAISERKRTANRNNALRSTGPKTRRGKLNVRANAIRHGILAREAVITSGDGKECAEDFLDLLEQLQKDYHPSGGTEELLVQTIAVCWWRLARVVRAENGDIRKRLDTMAIDRAQQRLDNDNLVLASARKELHPSATKLEADNADQLSAIQRAGIDLRRHQSGLTYMRAILENAKGEIARGGYISKYTLGKIHLAFSSWDYWFVAACDRFCASDVDAADPLPGNSSKEQGDEDRAEIVAYINRQIELVAVWEQRVAEQEKLQGEAQARSFSLPDADATDRLLRYQSHLYRLLFQAMDQLERLQRQRKGENVPPPLNINLRRKA